MSSAGWSAPEALAHADRLYNLGRRLTGNDADAEELVQETYVRALAGARTFGGGNLKAWLFKILRNTFVDLRRRVRAAPAGDGLVDVAGGDDAPLLRDDLELERLRRLVGEEIEAALASLSVYGAALAGWSSFNNFGLLGGLRAAAQMISYEVTMGLTLVGALLVYGTLEPMAMVRAQGSNPFTWGIVVQPLGFLLEQTHRVALGLCDLAGVVGVLARHDAQKR